MQKYSDRLNRLSYSQTFVMSNKVRELKAQGIDVIGLTLGEPDFNVPENVKEAAIQAVHDNYSHYSPVPGFLELREAVAKKLKRDNNLDYKPTQIVVSNGAKQSILNVLLSTVNDGDEVILPAPYWVSYAEMVKLVGGKCVFIETSLKTDFKMTAAELEAAITPKTKVLLYSSPCNPSGSYYTGEELKEIAAVIVKHPQITVISDEIYEYLNYEGQHVSLASFPEIYEQVATVNGMSKAYAMTGWRIGYCAAPEWLAKACDKVQGQMTSGANAVAQRASIEALNHGKDYYKSMIDAFQRRRDLIFNLMSELPGFKVNKPKSAFYIFPDISYYIGKTLHGVKINDADNFAMFLLNEAKVACIGGTSFGNSHCLRFSYATSDDTIKEAMKRLKEFLSAL